MKASKLSTKRKDSRMNHRDVLTAEKQENSKGATIIGAEASATGGN